MLANDPASNSSKTRRALSLAHSNETTVVGSVFEVRIADCKQTDERQTTLFDARLDARRALGQTDGLRGRSGGDRRCPVVERSGHRSRARARRVLERAPRATRARARSTDVRQVSAGGPENGGDRAGRRRVDVSTESSARMTSRERWSTSVRLDERERNERFEFRARTGARGSR